MSEDTEDAVPTDEDFVEELRYQLSFEPESIDWEYVAQTAERAKHARERRNEE